MPSFSSASDLLLELGRRGVELNLEGDRLTYKAPRGALDDLKLEIKRLKPALLELLASKQGPLSAPTWRDLDSRAILRAWRRVHPHLLRGLNIQEQHALAVSLACLDAAISPPESLEEMRAAPSNSHLKAKSQEDFK